MYQLHGYLLWKALLWGVQKKVLTKVKALGHNNLFLYHTNSNKQTQKSAKNAQVYGWQTAVQVRVNCRMVTFTSTTKNMLWWKEQANVQTI